MKEIHIYRNGETMVVTTAVLPIKKWEYQLTLWLFHHEDRHHLLDISIMQKEGDVKFLFPNYIQYDYGIKIRASARTRKQIMLDIIRMVGV